MLVGGFTKYNQDYDAKFETWTWEHDTITISESKSVLHEQSPYAESFFVGDNFCT